MNHLMKKWIVYKKVFSKLVKSMKKKIIYNLKIQNFKKIQKKLINNYKVKY